MDGKAEMNASIRVKFSELQKEIKNLIEEDEKENEKSKFALIRLSKRKLSRYHNAFSKLFEK